MGGSGKSRGVLFEGLEPRQHFTASTTATVDGWRITGSLGFQANATDATHIDMLVETPFTSGGLPLTFTQASKTAAPTIRIDVIFAFNATGADISGLQVLLVNTYPNGTAPATFTQTSAFDALNPFADQTDTPGSVTFSNGIVINGHEGDLVEHTVLDALTISAAPSSTRTGKTFSAKFIPELGKGQIEITVGQATNTLPGVGDLIKKLLA